MRWFWIDQFTEFISGTRSVAIKTVSLSEGYLHDHIPGFPYMSGALIIEGFAQSGGLLVGEASGFQERVVLAKVARAEFHDIARPGDTFVLKTQVEDIRSTGGIISGSCHIGERLLANVELVFANLDEQRTRHVRKAGDMIMQVPLGKANRLDGNGTRSANEFSELIDPKPSHEH
jgi:3-hydroxyacyl-[acyl-carrier-protein] dehydratase